MNCSAWILKLFGWKTVYSVVEPAKSVICVAPHTSNWDFIIGKLSYWAVKKKAGFLMKKSWFVFPLGLVFKAMGGVPIDRSKRKSVTQQMIDEFSKHERFHLAITPEGTRKPTTEWKKGFYYIAKGAGVPIQLAYLDYEKKEMGITEVFYPTDNEEADFQYIYSFYKDVKGRKPENFILPS
ncbi:MAG: acyltransferase [Porphyromonadaceae bacterium]|jgi:1-acyl-sn-glycerol-3-phosphate acyltransferase|nr:acyltransferase [Porphyromonadaceae bacterium]